ATIRRPTASTRLPGLRISDLLPVTRRGRGRIEETMDRCGWSIRARCAIRAERGAAAAENTPGNSSSQPEVSSSKGQQHDGKSRLGAELVRILPYAAFPW